jgi:ATP synthase protein I
MRVSSPVRALRAGVLACLLVAAPSVALSAVAAGGRGAAGAAAGAGVALAFFALGKIALLLSARFAPILMLPVALAAYGIEAAGLGAALIALQDAPQLHRLAFAWSALAAGAAWIGAELVVAARTREPFFDPEAFARRRGAPAADAGGPAAPLAAGGEKR